MQQPTDDHGFPPDTDPRFIRKEYQPRAVEFAKYSWKGRYFHTMELIKKILLVISQSCSWILLAQPSYRRNFIHVNISAYILKIKA